LNNGEGIKKKKMQLMWMTRVLFSEKNNWIFHVFEDKQETQKAPSLKERKLPGHTH
jgi:hypothetical protein